MLEVLDLGCNKFSDNFRHWLEKLHSLQVLILRSNKFHGPMPTSEAKFPFLNLRVMDLSDNYFTGPLPKKYFKNFNAVMNVDEASFKLQYLSLLNSPRYYYSLTIVIKGSTIEMVKVLTIFTAIDLSENNFEGEIPEIIGRLNSIRGLNLSHNNLTSHIPASLANLTTLKWLDLSSNELTGKIPQQLRSLISLQVLNLSQNQLVGPIPQGNQFDTFLNDSYIGNLALYGPPLLNTCNPRTPQPPPLMFQQEDNTSSGFNWYVILSGYGCGLVWGFFMGYLMFSRGKSQWLVRIIEAFEVMANFGQAGVLRNAGKLKIQYQSAVNIQFRWVHLVNSAMCVFKTLVLFLLLLLAGASKSSQFSVSGYFEALFGYISGCFSGD
ncbi:hypothetical protein ACSBR2_025052 [Camellia fascicularis]